jgi:hypothetical protein
MRRKIHQSVLFIIILFLIFALFPFSTEINAQSETVPGFDCYRNLNAIYARAAQLETQYPQFVSLIDIGDSWKKVNLRNDQGYDLFALKIENNTMSEPKPSLILVSGLKANAFAPVEINLRFAEFLLSERETDNTINYLLNNFSIHFIFIANPDGRAIAESLADGSGNPLDITWTKNANPSGCSNGNGGVSLERNFAYQWNHTPTDGCAPDYPGTSALSEPETKAIRSYLQAIDSSPYGENLLIDLESKGNFIVHPYLYSKSHKVENYDAYQIMINKFAYGQIAEPLASNSYLIFPQYGALIDDAHAELGMVTTLYLLGNDMDGGDLSSCAAFDSHLAEPAIQSLLRVLKTMPNPLEYAAGPEIVNIVMNHDTNEGKVTIAGQLNALSYYHRTDRASYISSMHYSINLPPWHPDAELIPINTFERDIEYPGLADFTFSIGNKNLPSGKVSLFIQGVAEDPNRNNKRDAGFIEVINIYNQELYFPYIAWNSH